ncbi:MAG: nicotinate-nucleotide adenylyltransferase [Candidatus Saccharimonadales bacterium]
MARIGIYAGTFDPVHIGHMTFALQALTAANLDRLYFLPERRPRNKQQVEHYGHRVAMLKRASLPYKEFEVLETVDVNFSVEVTLPRIIKEFKNDQLVFLFGSDVISGLTNWPKYQRLLTNNEVVIGLRQDSVQPEIRAIIESWSVQPKAVTLFNSFAPEVSSGKVRAGLQKRQPVKGLLSSVARYSDRHWLYVSLA